MKSIKTELDGVLLLELVRHADTRGSLIELWQKERYADLGFDMEFIQDNVSVSTKGVLRGLHFQNPGPQAKLISVSRGSVFDVAVDIRVGSPTFGKWTGSVLSDENCRQMYIAEGFAHGFVVLSGDATVIYKLTAFYRKECERTILWNDPAIAVDWPVRKPILSDKDREGLLLNEMPPEYLFRYDRTVRNLNRPR